MVRRLVVTLIGKVNAGKSLLCNRLLKKDLASVKPVAGWTKEVTLYPLAPNVALADTPGLDDVEEAVASRTFDFVGQTDIFLHVINSDEGLTRNVERAHASLVATGRPILLVCNKADHLEEGERLKVAAQVRKALPAGHLAVTSAATGAGMEDLARELYGLLQERGEELRFAQFVRVRLPELLKGMAEEADSHIRWAVAKAAALAMVPIPLASYYPLHVNLKIMFRAIAATYGLELGKAELKNLPKAMGASFGALVLASMMPPVQVALAAAITYGAGQAAKAWFISEKKLATNQLKDIYRSERDAEKGRRRFALPFKKKGTTS